MKKYQIGVIAVLILGVILLELVKPDLEQEALSVAEKMIESFIERDLGLMKETLTEELYTDFAEMSVSDDSPTVKIIRLNVSKLINNEAEVEYEILVSNDDLDDTETGIFHLIRINGKWKISQISY